MARSSAVGPSAADVRSGLRQFVASADQAYVVVALTFVLVVLFALTLDAFFTTDNVLSAIASVSVLGILSVGMAVVVLGRGLDLSIVVIMGVAAQFATDSMLAGRAELTALGFALGLALMLGLINGALVAYAEIPPLFVTLATALLFGNVYRYVYVDLQYRTLPDSAELVTILARSKILGVPTPVLVLAAVAIALHGFVTRTTLGGFIRAIGDNPRAASLTGIPVRWLTTCTYVISAALAFVAGLVHVGLVGSYDVRSWSGTLIYDVIAVVVIGGVSLAGGRGKIPGVLAAAVLIGILTNAMVLLDYNVIEQSLLKAVIVLAALVLDARLHPRNEETARVGEL